MKSLSYLFCVLCLTFTLTGCSGDAGADKKDDTKPAAGSAEDSSDDKKDEGSEDK